MSVAELDDAARPAARPGRRRAAPRLQRGRACSTPPTSTSRTGSPRWPARTSRRWRWPSPSPCARSAAGRCASTWPPSPPTRGRRRPALARPRGVAARPWRRVALAGTPPVLRVYDGRLLYLDRYWREEEQVRADLLGRPRSPSRSTTRLGPRSRRDWTGSSPPRATTSSGPPPRRALASAPPCSPVARAPARPPPSRRCWRCSPSRPSSPAEPPLRIALAAPTGKAAARLQQAVEAEVANLPAEDQARLAGVRRGDAAPAARQPSRHLGAVPAPPRQPAAARRDRGRRDLDGLADDDGAAARGGAARDPADPGRRPRPARVRRGRRRARRPGRGARRDAADVRSPRC